MECHLEVRHDGSVAVLHVRGEIDVETAPKLEECIALLLRAAVEQVVVDLAEVTFVDSSGIYVLIRSARMARGKAKVVIINPSDHVQRVFSITGAERAITIAAAEDFAYAGAPLVTSPNIIQLPR